MQELIGDTLDSNTFGRPLQHEGYCWKLLLFYFL